MQHRTLGGGLSRAGLFVVPVLLLCAISGAAGFVLGEVRHRVASSAASTAPAPDSPELTTNRESTRVASTKAPCSSRIPLPGTLAVTLASDLTSTLRGRLQFQRTEGRLLEAQMNSVDDFLVGAIHSLRLVNPAVFGAMAREWEDDICSGKHKEDADLMLFARLGTIEADIASSKALGCALDGRPQEDIVLFSLLRAWNAKGQPNLAPIEALRSTATDERTKSLLLPPDEQRRVQLEQAEKDQEVAQMMRSRGVSRGASNRENQSTTGGER